MIVNKYQGNGGGGGGSYVLPTATANRLGGVKVGSGVTITNDGTLSTEEATVIDLAVLSAMTSADRVDFWDEVYGKVSDGKSVFMKGLVYGEADRTAILPVVSFRPETSAATHDGGNIFFGAKGDTDNIYFHINFGSDGSINPTDGMVKTFISGKASTETLGLVKVGSGLTIDASGVLSVSGGTAPAGGKTPIILEEHYDDQEWLPIYNAVAQSAVTMGVDEFAKNYDIYLIRNDGGFYQAVGYAIQEGEDDGVTTNWLKFYTFDNGGYTYWLLSTGSRGIGAIGGFDNNMPHPKSAWITIDTSGNVIGNETNINDVDEGLAQYPDHGTDYAFSMYLCCLVSDAERYRGNLQNYRKNYNGVNGNHFFRFIIDIDGTEYEAEYYYDTSTGEIVKIVFQTYKAYLQGVLNS